MFTEVDRNLTFQFGKGVRARELRRISVMRTVQRLAPYGAGICTGETMFE